MSQQSSVSSDGGLALKTLQFPINGLTGQYSFFDVF